MLIAVILSGLYPVGIKQVGEKNCKDKNRKL